MISIRLSLFLPYQDQSINYFHFSFFVPNLPFCSSMLSAPSNFVLFAFTYVLIGKSNVTTDRPIRCWPLKVGFFSNLLAALYRAAAILSYFSYQSFQVFNLSLSLLNVNKSHCFPFRMFMQA